MRCHNALLEGLTQAHVVESTARLRQISVSNRGKPLRLGAASRDHSAKGGSKPSKPLKVKGRRGGRAEGRKASKGEEEGFEASKGLEG